MPPWVYKTINIYCLVEITEYILDPTVYKTINIYCLVELFFRPAA